jgi:hypothetical protein
LSNTWVRAYHGSHTHFYVYTGDLQNFKVKRDYADSAWAIFADYKLGSGEVAMLGAWTTEGAAANALRDLLRPVDISD